MAALFPGAGGNASTASLKIQLVFDYRQGRLEQLELGNGRQPDQGYRGHWARFQNQALVLFDLGYFVLDTFKAISDHAGYFLSRLQTQTGLFDPAGQPLDLAHLLAHQTSARTEIAVMIGSRPQHRIPCRLIMCRLSSEAAARQRQKAKENARRHGRTCSPAQLRLLDWACFITNVPVTMLQTEHVAALYRLRWQIELVFKLCKSFCGLDYVATCRPHRILTELYGRLIGVVLTYFLIAPIRLPGGPAQHCEISPPKVRLVIQRFARLWAMALGHAQTFVALIQHFFRQVTQVACKQKRRKAPNALHAIALLSETYTWPQDQLIADSMADDLMIDDASFDSLPVCA